MAFKVMCQENTTINGNQISNNAMGFFVYTMHATSWAIIDYRALSENIGNLTN